MPDDLLHPQTLCQLRFADGEPLAAASGLVCTAGRVFVVGDDALHLGVFNHPAQPGRRHRLLAGALPREAKARKQAKPDFEALLRWQGGLLALGSGSKAEPRERAVALPLSRGGVPGAARVFSLAPLYTRLRAELGGLNIEGAMLQDEHLLLQRGNAGERGNALLRLPAAVLDRLQAGGEPDLRSLRVQPMPLGDLNGVPLGLTDACPLVGGRVGEWLFSAAAEATEDAVNDGAVTGSVIGWADAQGRMLRRWRLPGRLKVEGLDAKQAPDGAWQVAMVTDADDPAQPARLLRAVLR
jgi:hypothetical protein